MAFLDSPTPIAFAHRGFAPDGDENSMSAFERAVDLGYRYLETDIRATADGVAVAFHDERLDRVTDAHGNIERLPWEQVRRARIRGREPIPLLRDVLDRWPHVQLNVDMKSTRSIGPAIEAIRSADALDRVCVGAFATRRILAVRRELGPRVCTAAGPAAVVELRLGGRVRARGAMCIQAPHRFGWRPFVDRRYIEWAHRCGLPVHVYTVNARADMHALLDLGVDGIMTDRADVLRDVLTERGQWPN